MAEKESKGEENNEKLIFGWRETRLLYYKHVIRYTSQRMR